MKKHPRKQRQEILQAYERHLDEVVGLAAKTRRHHRQHVREFLEAVPIRRAARLRRLTPLDLSGYLTARSAHYQPASLRQVAGSLRKFLQFAQLRGWIDRPLSEAVPKIACRAHRDLPAFLNKQQLDLLLSSWDRNTALGKRDWAISLCLARLGLRAGEVAGLLLEDLDWRHGILRLKEAKNGHPAQLPLLAEVGQSIATYLRTGRPVCAHRHVFLRHRPEGPMSSHDISSVVRRALGCCGIEVPRPGAHLLRHTLASHLVQNGATLKEVADLLRHRHLNSAAVYAHVDITQLRSVAQPWPKEAAL